MVRTLGAWFRQVEAIEKEEKRVAALTGPERDEYDKGMAELYRNIADLRKRQAARKART